MTEEGFGLLEAAIAVAMIGLASAAALSALSAQLRSASVAERTMRAAAAAEYAFATVQIDSWSGRWPVGRELPISLEDMGDSASWHSFHATGRTSPTSHPGLINATVVVTWPDGEHRIGGILREAAR